MNEQELNRAAHEAMGKCWHRWEDPVGHGFKIKLTCCHCGQKKFRSHIPRQPDYCHDLNAAAELERFTIETVGRGRYEQKLDETAYFVKTADANERVRACLKALGKEIYG